MSTPSPPTPDSPHAIILCPLQYEYDAIAQSPLAKHNLIHCTGGGYDAVIYTLEKIKITLNKNNPGPPDHIPLPIILAGLAGSLSPQCTPGSAWVARCIKDEYGKTWPTTWPTPQNQNAVGLRMIDLLAADSVFHSPAEKNEAHHQFGAHLVDTESHALAEWARDNNHPFGVVRGVSDSHDHALPLAIDQWTRPDGSTNLPRITLDLTLHPHWIKNIKTLKQNSQLALKNVIQLLAKLGLTEPKQPCE